MKTKQISLIAALAKNNAIGFKNQLLCHLPADLKHFKTLTEGNTVIMGRNTFLSLPKGALPNRTNIVITNILSDNFEGCKTVYSIQEAIENFSPTTENFIIGGASVYEQLIEYADKLYITHIDAQFEADTFFPEIGNEWKQISIENHLPDQKNKYPYSFTCYSR